jgi:hypothetical protein
MVIDHPLDGINSGGENRRIISYSESYNIDLLSDAVRGSS